MGLLDADVYGPSVPKLMNLKGNPDLSDSTTLRSSSSAGSLLLSLVFPPVTAQSQLLTRLLCVCARQPDAPSHQLWDPMVSPAVTAPASPLRSPGCPSETFQRSNSLSPPRPQHVDGLPGGRRGPHRVARPDGDVSDRETAQTGLD